MNKIIDELTYISYKANRGYTPEIAPEKWVVIYPNALEMEKRLQEEKK